MAVTDTVPVTVALELEMWASMVSRMKLIASEPPRANVLALAPPMATATTWPWRLEGMSSVRAVWPSIVTGIVEGSVPCG